MSTRLVPQEFAIGLGVWTVAVFYIIGGLEWARLFRWILRSSVALIGRTWWMVTVLRGVAAIGAASLDSVLSRSDSLVSRSPDRATLSRWRALTQFTLG